MKPCPAETLWTDLAVGALKSEQETALRHHAESCTACAARLAETQRLFTLGRTLPAAPSSHLAERVWQALPGPTPRRIWRPVTVGVAALATVGALCLLPGTLTRPTPSFARVEAALDGIRTVTWHERAVDIFQDGTERTAGSFTQRADLPRARLVTRYVAAGRKEVNMLSITEGEVRWTILTGPRLWMRSRAWEVERRIEPQGDPRQWMRRAVTMPRDLAMPVADAGALSTVAAGDPSYRRTPWTRATEVRDGRRLLRFACEETFDAQDRPRKARLTVWVDPRTFRIVRRERLQRLDRPVPSGVYAGRSIVARSMVSDTYRYSQDAAEPGEKLPEPAVGSWFTFMDATSPHTIPEAALPEIRSTIERAAAAWNRRDGVAFNREWNFGVALQAVDGTMRGDPQRRAQDWKRRAERGDPWRTWSIDRIDPGNALPGPQVRQPGDPFPPAEAPNYYTATIYGKATVKEAKDPIPCKAAVTLYRDRVGVKIKDLTLLSAPSPRR